MGSLFLLESILQKLIVSYSLSCIHTLSFIEFFTFTAFCKKMTFTHFITFLLIGIGLSFDSFAVSVSCGLMRQEIKFKQAVIVAGTLSLFQAIFPLIGWYLGIKFNSLIQSIDHWIAFALLAIIGIKMIVEGVKPGGVLKSFNPFNLRVLLGLSVATSIDALVVGLSFGFLDLPILFPAIVIGGVTFIASMLGMLFGKNVPAKRSRQSIIIGGMILMTMGFKILIEHLWL
jgi:putative Mn2+ efflux pump MntP